MKLSIRRARCGAAILALSVGAVAHAQCLEWSSGFAPLGISGEGVGGLEAALDGVSCASGALIRFGSQNAVNGTAKYPNVPLGHTIPLSDRGATPVGSGLTGHYQVVYRDTAANFCTGDTLNFSSAQPITWN